MVGFLQRNIWKASFGVWGQFLKPEPNPEPTDFRQKIGQNSLPAKSYTASKKAGWLKLGILVRKQLYLLVTFPQSAVAGWNYEGQN